MYESLAHKVSTARTMLVFAFRIESEVSAGRIGSDICQRPVNIITGGEGVGISADDDVTPEEFSVWADNMVLLALYASALTCDDALDAIPRGDAVDEAEEGVRVLVNQLRNAFAHSPWEPKWCIFQQYRRVYTIDLAPNAQIVFDATKLDGVGVKPEDYGGLEGWLRVLDYCEEFADRRCRTDR